MRETGEKSVFRGKNASPILPAIFWFVLLAWVLAETLILGFSNWQPTSAVSRHDDDPPAGWADGPWSSNATTNASAASVPVQRL